MAAAAPILTWGSPILRSRCLPVQQFDRVLEGQAATMVQTMRRAAGVGLAAPQIGSLRRLVVIGLDPQAEPLVLVNPQWTPAPHSELEPAMEGCLSLPGIELPVLRHTALQLRYQSLEGEPQELQAERLLARAIQHETDHLDGILILDRVAPELRREALWALRGNRPLPQG